MIFFVYNIIGIIRKSTEVRRDRIRAEENKIELEQQKIELTNKISDIETDAGAERLLREKFRIVKPEEGLVVIVDEVPKQINVEKPSGSARVKAFFKNLFR
jgi:hypothetical protein